jgi:hypothetical protein
MNDFLLSFKVHVPVVSNPPTYASLQTTRNAIGKLASATKTTRGGGASGYMGIVLPGPVYELFAPGTPFTLPPNPGPLPVFHGQPTAAIIAATERTHKESLRQWHEYNNLHDALKIKLEEATNPAYLQSICHRRTGFNQVTLREMFLHLFNTYARLDGIQIHANRLRLGDPWDPSGRLEDLISRLEDIQELATDANRPIPDTDLTDSAFSSMFSCGLYDDECKTWEARPAAELTWPNFKAHFLEAQATLHRKRSRSTSNAGYTANAATQELEALVGQLVANNENYMNTARQDYAAFAANHQQRPNEDYSKILQELQNVQTELAAIKLNPGKKKPPPRTYEKHDGYCWTHGFRVTKQHNSSTCKYPDTGHQKEATKSNMMGGSTRKSAAD